MLEANTIEIIHVDNREYKVTGVFLSQKAKKLNFLKEYANLYLRYQLLYFFIHSNLVINQTFFNFVNDHFKQQAYDYNS